MNHDELILHSFCFFGHRKIDVTDDLINNLYKVIENLIKYEKDHTFLFDSKIRLMICAMKLLQV